MPKKWSEVLNSEGFKALPPDQQEKVRVDFFNDIVAPTLAPGRLDAARQYWDSKTLPLPGADTVYQGTLKATVPMQQRAEVGTAQQENGVGLFQPIHFDTGTLLLFGVAALILIGVLNFRRQGKLLRALANDTARASNLGSSKSIAKHSIKESCAPDRLAQRPERRGAGVPLGVVFDGDAGLATTFWVWGVWSAVLFYIAMNFADSSPAVLVVLPVYGIYLPIVLVGLYRAAVKYSGSVVWVVLTKITVVIGWVAEIALINLFSTIAKNAFL